MFAEQERSSAEFAGSSFAVVRRMVAEESSDTAVADMAAEDAAVADRAGEVHNLGLDTQSTAVGHRHTSAEIVAILAAGKAVAAALVLCSLVVARSEL